MQVLKGALPLCLAVLDGAAYNGDGFDVAVGFCHNLAVEASGHG